MLRKLWPMLLCGLALTAAVDAYLAKFGGPHDPNWVAYLVTGLVASLLAASLRAESVHWAARRKLWRELEQRRRMNAALRRRTDRSIVRSVGLDTPPGL